MATFECPVVRVNITDHPNADRLEIAKIEGKAYQSIVPKDKFETGDLAAYIPEDSIVPEDVQERLGVKGYLAGPDKNRVRTVRLRDVYSQGLLMKMEKIEEDYGYIDMDGSHYHVGLGDDCSDYLDIEKYEPPIPTQMDGEVFNARGRTISYDIENYKNHPDVIQEGERVVMTEKLHGTWGCVGVIPREDATDHAGRMIITSKGLSSKGLAFKLNKQNKDNLYVRAARDNGLIERLSDEVDGHLYILGEVFGNSVQDLQYGHEQGEISFRVFDVYIGKPQTGRYANDWMIDTICERFGLDRVPVLYRGPFSEDVMKEHTYGKDTISGTHVREGVVVRPCRERESAEIPSCRGRVQLKSVSEDYLTRKHGTEYQ